MEKAGKVMPSLVGGFVAGLALLATMVPVAGPFCCCALYLSGGVIASFTLVRMSGDKAPVGIGDGAVVGLFSGLWAGLLSAVLIFIFVLMAWDNPGFHKAIEQIIESQPPQNRDQVREIMKSPGLFALIYIGINFIFLLVVNLIGGMIGAALFEKRKGDKAGPPPSYPGYPGGDYPGGGYPGQ